LVEDAADASDGAEPRDDATHRVLDDRTLPRRSIYCLDLRVHADAKPFLEEIQRIAATTEHAGLDAWIGGQPTAAQRERLQTGVDPAALPAAAGASPAGPDGQRIDEDTSRRWYPVIDFSRCTNCLECIDFCLFGVYGIDNAETILVEQPDNCRKGCPACSRVCPENAIIFPQHKAPAIAGAPVDASSMKIDLSRLFGAPDADRDAVDVAVRERDEQLLLAGQKPVGDTLRPSASKANGTDAAKDELDQLLDELESCDL
jgi:NAD-dependent dihydropyrimidine dehydrogenase PreA subunit